MTAHMTTAPTLGGVEPVGAAEAVDAPAGTGPDQRDVDALRELLDLTDGFTNDQRARYLLTCNWFVREGVSAATRAAIVDAQFWASR